MKMVNFLNKEKYLINLKFDNWLTIQKCCQMGIIHLKIEEE